MLLSTCWQLKDCFGGEIWKRLLAINLSSVDAANGKAAKWFDPEADIFLLTGGKVAKGFHEKQ